MMISTKGRYALRIMVDLALHDGEEPVSVRAIAQRQAISGKYMEQIISVLTRAGLLRSVRGAQGGYRLAKEPQEITVGDIIDATEGPLSISDCLNDEGCCQRSGQCRTRRVWEYLSTSINDVLQSITLRDMLEQERFDCHTHDESKE